MSEPAPHRSSMAITHLKLDELVGGHVEDHVADVVEALEPSLAGVISHSHGHDVAADRTLAFRRIGVSIV